MRIFLALASVLLLALTGCGPPAYVQRQQPSGYLPAYPPHETHQNVPDLAAEPGAAMLTQGQRAVCQ